MKKINFWARISQFLLGSAIILLVFLAGTWVGKVTFTFAWDLAFLVVLGLALFGALLWILGFQSNNQKNTREPKSKKKDVKVIDHDI